MSPQRRPDRGWRERPGRWERVYIICALVVMVALLLVLLAAMVSAPALIVLS